MDSMQRRLDSSLGIAWIAVALAGCVSNRGAAPVPESAAVDREREVAVRDSEPSSATSPELALPGPFEPPPPPPEPPLTASASLGRYDARRDASLRLVIAGLDADSLGDPARALASYQRAVRLDATNPIAFLALARHHVAAGNPEEASAFLDQARALFESEGEVGSSVNVWGLGLRAWIDRAQGRDAEADSRFEAARALSPQIWRDELLSADELK
jgi:tetratricopeptide (TPR) repeat protein